MWLLWVALAVFAARYFEFSVFAKLSWWWIGGLFLLAFLWFEYFERWLGLENKQAFDELDKAKKKRIAEALARDKRGGRPGG